MSSKEILKKEKKIKISIYGTAINLGKDFILNLQSSLLSKEIKSIITYNEEDKNENELSDLCILVVGGTQTPIFDAYKSKIKDLIKKSSSSSCLLIRFIKNEWWNWSKTAEVLRKVEDIPYQSDFPSGIYLGTQSQIFDSFYFPVKDGSLDMKILDEKFSVVELQMKDLVKRISKINYLK